MDIELDDCYTITPAGQLGSVYEVGSPDRSLGRFPEWDDAAAAIRADMNRARYWPDVVFVDDHGGLEIVTV